MRSLAALVTALVLALGCGLSLVVVSSGAPPAVAAGSHPVPEATRKKTPKATATPSPLGATSTPRARTAADEEGERWVQLAVIGGGGLLGAVVVFLTIGALLRRRPRARGR
jgi:hypothetical protein